MKIALSRADRRFDRRSQYISELRRAPALQAAAWSEFESAPERQQLGHGLDRISILAPALIGDGRGGGASADMMIEDQKPGFVPAPAPGVTPPSPPPPPTPSPAPAAACPKPVNVRNGPFHAPIDEPSRIGMEIAITLTSSTGSDPDMATVEDSEQVGLSFNHTGSFGGMAPLPSNQSGFMAGHPIPNDRHTAPRDLIIDRADNHGGNGSFEKHQLDIFKAPACGITTPQVIPASGYKIKRIITTGPGTRIVFRTEKSPAACTVNGFTTTAGPSPTQADDVVVRT